MEEIVDCLRSGWSPETVVWWLGIRYGDEDPEVPSVRAVYRYRKRHIPIDAFVPASIIREKLKDIPNRRWPNPFGPRLFSLLPR